MSMNFLDQLPKAVRDRINRREWEEEEKAEYIFRQKQEEMQRDREERKKQMLYLYNNPELFLEEKGLFLYDPKGLFLYDPKGSISSQELYTIYRQWCIREELPVSTPRAFWLTMKEQALSHGMTYCTLTGKDGKRCRGFRGIRPLPAVTDAITEGSGNTRQVRQAAGT